MENTKLSNFFLELENTIKEESLKRKVIDKKESSNYNIFNQFFKLGENKTSELLAFFLDPNQTHGQGNLYLNSFLELEKIKVQNEPIQFNKVEVVTEKVIENDRRIDIYIDFNNGEHVLAIENKIWANDQPHQLYDYDKHLKKNTKSYQLIYLTPYGQNASVGSTTKNNETLHQDYIQLDYKTTIINLINQWIKASTSERINFLLVDFKDYLNQEINNIYIMNDYRNEIADYIIEENKIETIFKLNDSMQIVKEKLFEQFKQILSHLDFTVAHDFGEGQGAVLKLNESYHLFLGFHAKRNWFRIGIIKLGGKNINSSYEKSVADLMNQNFNLIEQWPNWVSVSRTNKYSDWSNNSKPWLDISNGKMKHFIAKLIADLKMLNQKKEQ